MTEQGALARSAFTGCAIVVAIGTFATWSWEPDIESPTFGATTATDMPIVWIPALVLAAVLLSRAFRAQVRPRFGLALACWALSLLVLVASRIPYESQAEDLGGWRWLVYGLAAAGSCVAVQSVRITRGREPTA
jgi:hypothetical protein